MKVKVKQLLKEQSHSLYWLARKTGLNYSHLKRIVQGETESISFETIEALCDALDCTPNDILELDK